MNYRELKGLDRRIDELAVRIDHLVSLRKVEFEDSIADLNKYLCVLISGYAEKYFVYLIECYSSRSSREIQRYIEIDFRRTTNVRMKKILDYLEKFSIAWHLDFQSDPDFERYEESIDYIVNNRNKISHGENTSLSKADLMFHRAVVKDMLKRLERYFGSHQSRP